MEAHIDANSSCICEGLYLTKEGWPAYVDLGNEKISYSNGTKHTLLPYFTKSLNLLKNPQEVIDRYQEAINFVRKYTHDDSEDNSEIEKAIFHAFGLEDLQ